MGMFSIYNDGDCLFFKDVESGSTIGICDDDGVLIGCEEVPYSGKVRFELTEGISNKNQKSWMETLAMVVFS